jgi:hypothetical protein
MGTKMFKLFTNNFSLVRLSSFFNSHHIPLSKEKVQAKLVPNSQEKNHILQLQQDQSLAEVESA